jgi:arylsulfatase A-like enzyme
MRGRLSRGLRTAAGLLAAGAVGVGCGAAPPARPDVVIVTWDTVRADHVGESGGAPGRSATPIWDGMAREGVVFPEARSPVPVTLPAHASLMTGMLPLRHGARDNGLFRVDPSLPTLAERFAGAGYATAAFVSAAVLDGRYGLARGFEVYDDAVSKRAGQQTVARRAADASVDQAIAWLEAQDPARPLFLWLHLYDAHRVWNAPEPWASRFEPYRAAIAFVDHETGRLLAALRSEERLDRALVALTSDHGEGLGEHGESTHTYFAYDSTLRVPLLLWAGARVGGALRPGSRVPGPAALVDLAPTLAELAGLAPAASDGRSLVPQLRGGAVSPRELPLESVVPALEYAAAPVFGLFTPEGETWFELPRRERYDLASDPEQRRNLYRPERDGARADALFARWSFAWPPIAPVLEPDLEARRQLEALGYLAGSGVVAAAGAPAVDPKDRVAVFEFLSLGARSLTEEAALARAEALRREHGPLLALERFRAGTLDAIGRSRDALGVVEELARRHPEDAELRADLAERRSARERQQALAAAIRRALDADPGHPSARRDLALTLHRLQDFDPAEALYRELLARDPGDDEVRANLARLLVAQEDHAEALDVAVAGGPRESRAPALDCIAGRILGDYLDRGREALPALQRCREAGGPLTSHGHALLQGAPG